MVFFSSKISKYIAYEPTAKPIHQVLLYKEISPLALGQSKMLAIR